MIDRRKFLAAAGAGATASQAAIEARRVRRRAGSR